MPAEYASMPRKSFSQASKAAPWPALLPRRRGRGRPSWCCRRQTMMLTERKIECLVCPAGRRDMMVFDRKQAGLGVRVTASGGKNYLAQYSRGGVKRRIPLGSCAAISLAQARNAARAIMGEVAMGRDPAVERKEAAAQANRAKTLGALT